MRLHRTRSGVGRFGISASHRPISKPVRVSVYGAFTTLVTFATCPFLDREISVEMANRDGNTEVLCPCLEAMDRLCGSTNGDPEYNSIHRRCSLHLTVVTVLIMTPETPEQKEPPQPLFLRFRSSPTFILVAVCVAIFNVNFSRIRILRPRLIERTGLFSLWDGLYCLCGSLKDL